LSAVFLGLEKLEDVQDIQDFRAAKAENDEWVALIEVKKNTFFPEI
jgi:hypothetical protein